MSKIIQFSTIGALMSGFTDGDLYLEELHNDHLFGLGCSCGVSGELTVYEGDVWEATAGEKVSLLKNSFIPFIQLTEFKPDRSFNCVQVDDQNFAQKLNQHIPIANIFIAVNLRAKFDEIVIRRPQRTQDTDRTISEMAETQQVNQLSEIKGQLIGFWTPELYGRISVPGFHFHFLSDDKKISGHVLSFRAEDAIAYFQAKDTIEIKNPMSEKYLHMDLDLKALDDVIDDVEK